MIVGVLVLLMCLAGSVSGLNKDTKNYILNVHNTYRKREGASNMAKLVSSKQHYRKHHYTSPHTDVIHLYTFSVSELENHIKKYSPVIVLFRFY